MKAKKQIFIFLSLVLVMSFVVLSCAEEKDEYAAPKFGKMTQDPDPAKVGENVVLHVAQEQKGNGIYSTTYEWVIKNLVPTETGALKDTLISVHTNYDGNGKADPTLTFTIPGNCKPGRYTVNMKGYFACYIGNVLYDESPTISGQLKIQ